MRGPMIERHCQSRKAADRVHHAGTREVAVTFSESKVGSHLREPTTTPCPVGKERIGECAHQHRRDREGQELPALCGRTGNDGQRRIHEDHLEEEDDHDAHIVCVSGEEHAALSAEAPIGAEEIQHMFADQRLQAAQVTVSGRAAHLDAEADDPVSEQAARVHEEVHHVGVVGILHSAQTSFNHRESGLHEHDQEARDQGPGEVDADLVLTNLVGYIGQRYSDFGVGRGHVIDRYP